MGAVFTAEMFIPGILQQIAQAKQSAPLQIAEVRASPPPGRIDTTALQRVSGRKGSNPAGIYQVAEHLRARRLKTVLSDFEPAPLPVHVVHREGRQASHRVRAFIDLAVERLRSDPSLN